MTAMPHAQRGLAIDGRWIFLMRVLIVALLMFVGSISRAAVIVPHGDSHVPLDVNFDRSALPSGNLYIWNNYNTGEESEPFEFDYRRSSFVCRSDSDTRLGACPAEPRWGSRNGENKTVIKLTLIEKRSGRTVDINATGFKQSSGWLASKPLNDAILAVGARGRLLTVFLPATELAKIPHGGRWRGRIELVHVAWNTKHIVPYATYTADINLNVTDKNNIAIYFSTQNSAAPSVDLGLLKSASIRQGGKIDGRAQLDMCLYDGFGANSSSYRLRLSDGQANVTGRPSGLFSVGHVETGITSDAASRVDYAVSLNYNQSNLLFSNGEEKLLPDVGQASTRSVNLSNIPGSVLCTPAMLTLTTPSFDALSKRAGDYEGILRVEFTPNTDVP